MSKFKFDTSFISSEDTCTECCPNCAGENEIPCDGTGVCIHCGHTNMLPCRACQDVTANDYNCDWRPDTRCTPFPRRSYEV